MIYNNIVDNYQFLQKLIKLTIEIKEKNYQK